MGGKDGVISGCREECLKGGKMPRLRAHHLICLHFFNGEGYDRNFIENLEDVLEKVEDEDIEVCEGVDDVCIKCPFMKDYKCEYHEDAESEVKEMDRMAMELLEIKGDTKIRWQDLKERIPEIFPRWYANHCYDCDWSNACEKNGFYQRLRKGG